MSEQAGSDDEGAPVTEDLPYVDGRTASSEELRAQVAKESDPRVQHIEELRDDVAAIVDEIGSRFEVRSWVSRIPSRARLALIAAAALLALVVLRRRWTSRHDRTT